MIITCPSCQTQYRIQPAALGAAGRTVRCAGCGHRWFVEPPGEPVPPPPLPAAPVEPRATTTTARGAEGPPARKGSPVAWLLLTLLVLLLAALVAGRNEIVAQFPAALPYYEQLGLPVNPPLALEFRDLVSEERDEGGRKVLVVRGIIQNVSGQERQLPPIRVALLDERGKEIDFDLFDPPRPTLGPGGSAPFDVQLGTPPPEARNFTVSFETPQGG